MFDVPVTHVMELLRVRDGREKRTADQRTLKQAGGGVRGKHEQYRAQRRAQRGHQ